jgi:hypothetical protein
VAASPGAQADGIHVMKIFSVNPAWPGARSRYHYVVAAIDEVDAARQAFDIMKPKTPVPPAGKWARTRWERSGPPPEWHVSRMFTPEEFRENLDYVKFDDEMDESAESTYDPFSNLLFVHKVIRL